MQLWLPGWEGGSNPAIPSCLAAASTDSARPELTTPSTTAATLLSEDRSDEELDTGDDIGPHRFTHGETVMIFDWDDTVLPSSWIQENGFRLDEDSTLDGLAELAKLAAETLQTAKRLGTVVLVTNAERGWIELSCRQFLPALGASLEGVKLLSARTEYERPDVPNPTDWKLRAFSAEINRLYAQAPSGGRKNILSFGDSCHEREALMTVTADLANCHTKSLKFCERPGLDQLRRQHALITSCLPRLVHHEGNIDLFIRQLT